MLGRLTFAIVVASVALRGAESTPASDWPTVREQTFQLVWQTVNEAYFDATFGGVDWPAVGRRYRERLGETADKAQLRHLLRTMLAELRRSHFEIMPREAAVFTPAERTRLGTAGATVAWIENEPVVARVDAQSPSAQAGVRPGDAVTEVDGVTIESMRSAMVQAGTDEARAGHYVAQWIASRLHGAVGAEVRLRGRRSAEETWQASVTFAAHEGPWSEPLGNFPAQPVVCRAERAADGIGYLRFNSFTPPIMKDVRAFLKSLKPGDGLIVDLRGNPGGLGVMAPGIAGWLLAREASLGSMRMRQGLMQFPVYPQEGAFLGPVAILIDRGSASTSEIFAAGLRDLGRARLFGEHSAGAALPSAFKTLPTGDLFQFAIADMQTPKGQLLEGRGVEPDEAVTLTRRDLAAGRDAVREAAQKWLNLERRGPKDRAFQGASGR